MSNDHPRTRLARRSRKPAASSLYPGTVRHSQAGIFREADHPARVLAVAAGAFVLLVVSGIALRPGQDLGLARALNDLHTGAVGVVASAIYMVLEPLPSMAFTAAVAVVIWLVRGLRTGAAFAGVVAATWIPTELIKVIVHRGRPDINLMPYPFLPVQTDSSFPSGHTAFIVALVVALAFVFRGKRWRWVVVGGGAIVIAVVGLALAVDAVHYPSDIVASIVWSLAVAPAARLIWVDWVIPRIPALARPVAASDSFVATAQPTTSSQHDDPAIPTVE